MLDRRTLVVLLALSMAVDIAIPGVEGAFISLDEIVLVAFLVIFSSSIARRVRHIDRRLLLLAVLEVVASHLGSSSLDPTAVLGSQLRAGALVLAFGILASGTQRQQERAVGWFVSTWSGVSRLSSAIILIQAAGLLPNLALVSGALVLKTRPTGLQADPNYAALVIVLSLVMQCVVSVGRPSELLRPTVLLELAALAATESRMGIVLLVAGAGFSLVRFGGRSATRVGLVAAAVVVVVGSLSALGVGAGVADGGVGARFGELRGTYEDLADGSLLGGRGLRQDSAAERIVLADGALRVWLSSPVRGVGPDRLTSEIRRRTGIEKAGHNGYLDRLAIGGLAGLATIALYLWVGAALWLRGSRSSNGLVQMALTVYLTTALAQLFLNTTLWLPMGLAIIGLGIRGRRPSAVGRTDSAVPGALPAWGDVVPPVRIAMR